MKVIIVSIHTLLAFAMLLSFPTVESMGGKWDPPCMLKRRNMAQNDPLMVPTQSKLVEKDDGISAEVADEKGRVISSRSNYLVPLNAMTYFVNVTFITVFILGSCKGEGIQCWIAGPPPQCCGNLMCSPTKARTGGSGVCRKGI